MIGLKKHQCCHGANKGGIKVNLMLTDKLKQYLEKKNVTVLTVDQVDLKNC